MATNIAAVVNGGIVENVIVIEPCAIPAVKASMGFEYLIPVDDTVHIGDSFDAERSIFLRDGVRVYPQKTEAEKIADLETQIEDTQAAIIELAEIVGGGS